MTFRAINQKYLAPGAQLLMIFGIIACASHGTCSFIAMD